MITRIEVDGFKSLDGFHLEFSKGLNVLVGPNGSGKTNIVSFFEFIAHLMETDASEATSRVGGAGAVFRRVGIAYERKIRARIAGCISIGRGRYPARKPVSSELSYCMYDYSFSLTFPESRESILYETQRLRLKRVQTFTLPVASPDSDSWGVDVVSHHTGEGLAKVTLIAHDKSLLDIPYYVAPRRQSRAKPKPDEVLSQFMGGTNSSLVTVLARLSPTLWALTSDLTGGQIYNVVPSRLKLPEDSAKPPGIARDGSGLSATLYALQHSREHRHGVLFDYAPLRHTTRYDPKALDRLKAYLKLVNSSVSDILVENDPFDNQLRVKFTIKNGSYEAVLPMSLMSDGTLKWLAIVTAAVTARSVFCIEEPENYLHPEMQGQIVTILREVLFQGSDNRISLMTTHSETLLNRCTPDELIIVSMNEGRTEAKRCANAAEISKEIQRTGFGLGYYFVSRALQND